LKYTLLITKTRFSSSSLLVLFLLLSFAFSHSADSTIATSVQYIPLPPNTTPLNSLLPTGGIGQQNGALMNYTRQKNYVHDIDISTRELEVKEQYINKFSRDTLELWSAHYPELALYVMDMYDIGLRRLWLNSLIGKPYDGYTPPETGSMLDITIPVNMPAWMKDFGFNKPRLFLQGSMDIRLLGRGEKDNAPGSTADNLWPSPTLDYNPSFMVKGKIGPYVTVEINNVESGLGVKNQVRVVYEESFKNEFEDYILQRIEAGTTSLGLSGTELTGYSENHQGLFGIKADWKFGDWKVKTIASQDGGSQEEYTINASESTSEFQILDKGFIPYRYYFLNHDARNAYIKSAIVGQMTSSYPATNLKLYKRSSLNTSKDVLEKITVVYKTQSGEVIEKEVERMIEIPASDYVYDSKTGILKINGVSKNTLIAASWSNDGTERKGTTISKGSKVVLIQWDATLSELKDIDKLMLRNVYSVGISDESSSNFILRLKDKSGNIGSFLKSMGIADSITGQILVNDNSIFKKDASGSYTGEMWLPCLPSKGSIETAKQNCLEPLRWIDSSATLAQMYTLPVHNLNRYTSRFYFESVGKRRSSTISVRDPNSSYSVSAGSCMDISPGTEKLKAGSEILVRGTDYDVNYELGQIELLSDRALDPNKQIKVTFECEPLFEIDSKVLLGARAELPLNQYGFSEGSIFGITALYKSQNTTATIPTLGNEPYSSFLWGFNLRLLDSAAWLDSLVQKVPLLDAKAPSSWRFEAEYASSYHNANTSDNNSALVEDFENSTSGLIYPMSRTLWFPASPPGGVAENVSTYIEHQDYRHQGEFIWHSNNTELYKNIYPNVGNSEVDNQHLSVLKMTLRPNDNLVGKSWGGIMRPNSSYYEDLSQKKYIEIVARGNVGSIYLDLGLISEDISINGASPNKTYDGENDLGFTTALHDKGLDGLSGNEEKRIVWDCRVSGCEWSYANPEPFDTDIAKDNFNPNLDDDSDPPVSINGTEGNAGERSYDSEDINRNGALDVDISFVRYRIDLSSNDSTLFETLKNGWRRWRIPLSQYDTIVSQSGNNYNTILSESQFTRLWLGNLNPGVSEAKVQIVQLGVMGNYWEETDASEHYMTSSTEQSQVAEINGSETEVSASVNIKDTAFIDVSTINNRENADVYFKSPNSATERDVSTNAVLKETALVLKYKNLSPGQEVGVTRVFDNGVKDFTSYKSIKMEIHYETKAATVPIRFALQFGEGALEGSNNYYEWSFKPVNYNCVSARVQDCHEENWLDNAFAMSLSAFSDLKKGRRPPYLVPVEKNLGGERDEKIKLVGNPSTSSVDWIRFVIIADEGASTSDLNGTFWVNDLRLSEMDADWGNAIRLSGQVNVSDFMTLSGALRYQDGDFATLSTTGGSPKPSLSVAASQLDVAGDVSFNLNKFFNEEHGLRIPMSFGYSSTTTRPYLKPTDDLQLSRDNIVDISSDFIQNKLTMDYEEEQAKRDAAEAKGYQSYITNKNFSLSYSKEYKPDEGRAAEILSQVFLERPAWSYSYNETESKTSINADSTYSYRTMLEYRLGTFNRFNYKPFKSLQNKNWAKSFVDMSFEPWPQTFDLTLIDFSYVRYVDQDRHADYVEPQSDKVVTYTADLNHKANIRWNILPFLSTSYSVNIKRDMYGGGDREDFTAENLFSFDEGGLFAMDRIFDYDHSDRRVYVSRDSVIAIPIDTIATVTPTGDTMTIDLQNQSSYKILYDSTYFYKVDSVGQRHYGKAYGILRNERARNQQFRVSLTPSFISFLPFSTSFTSDFSQQKTIPDQFSLFDETTLEKNFWTISQTNRFELAPTFKLIEFAKLFGKENSVAKLLEKLKWREFRTNWTVNLNTIGENFTLAQLYEDQGVNAFQYYLYGLGLGNGYKNRGLWNIISGDMALDSRDDYRNFAQYLNQNVDTIVYQGNFKHAVSRAFQIASGLTLPFWDIVLTGDLQWKQDFAQSREYPLYIDSTVIWPKIGVGMTIPNFAKRLSFLSSFKSVSTSHRMDYSYMTTVKPFQSAEDSWTTIWNFNPLVRLSFLLNNNIRIDNSVRLKLEYSDRRPKEEVISQTNWPAEQENIQDTSSYFLNTPWMHTSLYKDYGYNVANDLTITYPFKTKRGFQLWKWYIKLKNDIDIKLTAGYEYKKTIRELYDTEDDFNMTNKESGTDGVFREWNIDGKEYVVYKPSLSLTDRTVPLRTHEWFIRPNVAYQFNKMASASAYIEYRQIHEKLDDETPHLKQILMFEIALMLKFN
jgi:cell surface protein SprA